MTKNKDVMKVLSATFKLKLILIITLNYFILIFLIVFSVWRIHILAQSTQFCFLIADLN